MGLLKGCLERTYIVLLVLCLGFGTCFWLLERDARKDSAPLLAEPAQGEGALGWLEKSLGAPLSLKFQELSADEKLRLELLEDFSQTEFPPKIDVVRSAQDLGGHLAFYSIFGHLLNKLWTQLGNPGSAPAAVWKLRAVCLGLTFFAFYLFTFLGMHYIQRNRLNPLWVSLALIVFAVNPSTWEMAFRITPMPLFLCCAFLSWIFFQKENLVYAAVFAAFAVLVDWHGLILAIAFAAHRIGAWDSRLIRPERIFAVLLPFAVAALPLMAWKSIVPAGAAQEIWTRLWEAKQFFRIDRLFYSMAILAVYPLYFGWAWIVKARARSLTIGLIATGILIPIFFIFPIAESWNGQPLGNMDALAQWVVGPYKNLLIFIPWLAGACLFVQLCLMENLEGSRSLVIYLLVYMGSRPFYLGNLDFSFLIALPFVLLLSLSEAYVGEEGNLAS